MASGLPLSLFPHQNKASTQQLAKSLNLILWEGKKCTKINYSSQILELYVLFSNPNTAELYVFYFNKYIMSSVSCNAPK